VLRHLSKFWIALANFYSINPTLRGYFSGLQVGVHACIVLTGPRTMITSGPPTPPVPSPFQVLLILQSLESRVYHCVKILVIQAEITIDFLKFYFVQSHNDCFIAEQVAGIMQSVILRYIPTI
jgi:hypothetical protein